MPLLCPLGFDTCTVTLDARERYRKNNTDGQSYVRILLSSHSPRIAEASPGYFAQTLDNNIKVRFKKTSLVGLN